MICALFWCRVWKNVNFVGIYLFHCINKQHLTTVTFEDTPFSSTRHGKHLNKELYRESHDCDEGYCDSDINLMASVNIQ